MKHTLASKTSSWCKICNHGKYAALAGGKGTTEDEMVAWHHRLDGHEFEQALEVGDGQGSLACCQAWGLPSPWGHKESDTTDQLN